MTDTDPEYVDTVPALPDDVEEDANAEGPITDAAGDELEHGIDAPDNETDPEAEVEAGIEP